MVAENEYTKFKKLLEYFVAHLEYVTNKDKQHPGYDLYIRPLEEAGTFKYTGTGYNGQQIQQQVSEWSNYAIGEVAMNCSPQYGNYRTRLCYLNWIPTGLNVNAIWDNEHISSLQLQNFIDKNTWIPVFQPTSLEQLGLYDGNAPNDTLKAFCDSFVNMKREYDQIMKYKIYTDILEKNYNLVLTGAPGTGKTFLAKEIAYVLTGDTSDNHPHIGFVQFHPSYDYTDFVEGLRPVFKKDSDNIGFERKDGIFKAFCATAAADTSEQKYVFIIDEINRGDIAKIFGELFYAIDRGYRGEKGRIKTQYENLITAKDREAFKGDFYVPKNVYIVGTMNDIDRNVESMDFAIRRRFTWMEIKPEQNIDMWDDAENGIVAYKGQAEKTMKAINACIKDTEGLGAQYQLGAAYFMMLREYEGDFSQLWERHIAPLLNEYLRGIPKADNLFMTLEKAWNASLSSKDDSSQAPSMPPNEEQATPAASL